MKALLDRLERLLYSKRLQHLHDDERATLQEAATRLITLESAAQELVKQVRESGRDLGWGSSAVAYSNFLKVLGDRK